MAYYFGCINQLLTIKRKTMKKVLSIVAVAVFSLGMFSCEAETDVQETADLFESLEKDATDAEQSDDDDR